MEIKETRLSVNIGVRTTSDVIVRLRTQEGRDEWFYCHSHILTEKSKYFADRLSKDWPTCQILDSRHCVEVYCHELEFNSYVSALRLLYVTNLNICHGVRNALGILQVSVHLGCRQLADACIEYLEAVPWEETEEEEILKIVPTLGTEYASILSRLQPVEPTAITGMFISTIRFASSSPPTSLHELKSLVQEQLEYMLTEDDDLPLLNGNDMFKFEVRRCMKDLLSRFNDLMESFSVSTPDITLSMDRIKTIKSFLADLSWASQILCKMEMMKELVHAWVSASSNVVKLVDFLNGKFSMPEMVLKVVEVTSKVLEAIGYGNVILPTSKRIHMVKIWLPFMQKARAVMECADSNDENDAVIKPEAEMWQSLEAAFVSIVLALPSGDQADVLAEWLRSEHVRYPDLTEAFELWCYRSKVARRRFIFRGLM